MKVEDGFWFPIDNRSLLQNKRHRMHIMHPPKEGKGSIQSRVRILPIWFIYQRRWSNGETKALLNLTRRYNKFTFLGMVINTNLSTRSVFNFVFSAIFAGKYTPEDLNLTEWSLCLHQDLSPRGIRFIHQPWINRASQWNLFSLRWNSLWVWFSRDIFYQCCTQ